MASLLDTLKTTAPSTVPQAPVTSSQTTNSSGNPGTLSSTPTGTPGQTYQTFTPTSTVPIASADKAVSDLGVKKDYLDQTQAGMAEQWQKVAAAQQTAADQAAQQKQQGIINAQKQAEIDAKGKIGADISEATGTGTTGSTTGTTPTDEVAAANKALQDQNGQMDEDNAAYSDKITQIQNGSFPLTDSQKGAIADLKKQFDTLIQNQQLANKNYEGGITQLGITSGRSRYAPELEMGNIKGAINEGISKIDKIQSEENQAVAQMQQGFMDKNYKSVTDAYDRLQALNEKKTANINQMHKNVVDANDKAVAAAKDAQKELDIQTKYSFDNLTKIAQSGAELSEEDLKKYDSYLGATGITKAFYNSEKQKTKDTEDLKFATGLSKLPIGATVERGGLTYTSTQVGKNKQIAEYDKKTGITTIVTYDATGNIVNSVQKNVKTGGGTVSKSTGTITPKFKEKAAIPEMNKAINTQLGDEGYISKEDWSTLMSQWQKAGGTRNTFITKFNKYANPAPGYDYLGLPKKQPKK